MNFLWRIVKAVLPLYARTNPLLSPPLIPAVVRPIKKLMAANRSEIAIRIFRAATELNIRTVAIYSKEDIRSARIVLIGVFRSGSSPPTALVSPQHSSTHRYKADEAYLVGAGKGPVAAYLDIDSIIQIAIDQNVREYQFQVCSN